MSSVTHRTLPSCQLLRLLEIGEVLVVCEDIVSCGDP